MFLVLQWHRLATNLIHASLSVALITCAAEAELKQLAELSGGAYLENDLLRHNLVVFRGGENALQVREEDCFLRHEPACNCNCK